MASQSSESASSTYYEYLSVMQARNSAGRIDEGEIQIMNGKRDDGHRDEFMTGDNEVASVGYDLLEHLELPEPMTSRAAHKWVRENKEEYLVETYGGDGDE